MAFGDTYSGLVKRYEKQIKQQERQLGSLHQRLDEKSRDVNRWRTKADEAKSAWSDASASLEITRTKTKAVHEKRQQTRILADAAQWKTAENFLLSNSAATEARVLARNLYGNVLVNNVLESNVLQTASQEIVFSKVAKLSASSMVLAEGAKKTESSLRNEEMKLQNEEISRGQEAERLHQKQESQWMRWQQAQQRKNALEDEIAQIDQSAKALQVMVQELRDHRDQTLAMRDNHTANDKVLASLRGTLPWPAHGKVVQNFGRQFSDGLNQLVVSNGIKIDAGASHNVRVIQDGKVLFANAFRQYGQLVIVQHKNGITSVYAGLGQTQVKEGQQLAALDQLGVTGESGSFYFELRRDELPINPLVYLSPLTSSELSSRRKFR